MKHRSVFGADPVTEAHISGRLRVRGRRLENDAGIYRPRWSSALYILSRSEDEAATFIDWIARSGFNGFRVFAGDLGQVGQTPASALRALPFVLDYAASRGLYVEITAITGSATGFNLISHMQAVNALAIDYENVVVEVSNEPYHASQRAEVHDPSFLRRLSEIIDDDVPVALGAPADDESDEMAAGDYVTVHLDRGRDKWNMIRRVRELEALSSRLSKFVLNNEPKKAGSQESDPAIYFAQGVLERVFEIGGVLHSDWGLAARTPNNAEQAITDAYIRGATLIPSDGPWMTFKNASWGDSPIRSFDGAVRVYSGLSASANIAVALGLESGFRMETQNGWRVGEILAEMPGVRVYALER